MIESFEAQRKLLSGPPLDVKKCQEPAPIFVLGMMRSGTTLIEHMLACHSQVAGAGELDFWTGSERLLVDRIAPSFMTELARERRESYTKKVRTPSMWQVRQPIYKTSIDRWRRYEPWLGAFRELLQD